jgi:hypothetical protein
VRWASAQGLLGRRHHLQGVGLLPDRQPQLQQELFDDHFFRDEVRVHDLFGHLFGQQVLELVRLLELVVLERFLGLLGLWLLLFVEQRLLRKGRLTSLVAESPARVV